MREQKTRSNRPFQKFMKSEASSGVILIASVIIALIWANIDHNSYYDTWHIKVGFTFGSVSLYKSLIHWINDFLMSIFFLLIGLEIKREILIGELSDLKKAMLPIFAAIGGMVFPAIIFLVFNPFGSDYSKGWAVPMATDIAFALGILFILGKSVPTALRVFLATLAIVDDMGAVLIIAIFYSDNINTEYLILAAIMTVLLFVINKAGVRKFEVYSTLGLILWFALLKSGIHSTLAGIILALSIPATTKIDFEDFNRISNDLIKSLNESVDKKEMQNRSIKIYQNTLQTLEEACEDVQAPLQIIEHKIANFVTFIIVPIFAIANSGVVIADSSGGIIGNKLVWGIIFGLVIGKPLGILFFVYLAVKLKIAKLPVQLNWSHILGVGFLAGIGFTMSIFISSLAFVNPTLLAEAKLGILIASTVATLIGVGILVNAKKIDKILPL